MLLHSGANQATISDVRAVPTPPATHTYQPIPHAALLDLVVDQMEANGFRTTNPEYGLWGDNGERFFATFNVVNAREGWRDPATANGKPAPADHTLAVGLRNSHDKRFPAGLAVGSRVFVCDNLAFSGEIRLARRHTTHIRRDLPQMTARAVGKIRAYGARQAARIDAYKATPLLDQVVHDTVIRAVDARVLPVTKVPAVLKEWRNPRHAEFEHRNAWSLFNGFTEILKATNRFELPKRTEALHGLLDKVVSETVGVA